MRMLGWKLWSGNLASMYYIIRYTSWYIILIFINHSAQCGRGYKTRALSFQRATWQVVSQGTIVPVRKALLSCIYQVRTLTNTFSVFVHPDWYFPGTSFTPPFDRHDWVVRRPSTNEEVRYVIDYYSSRKRIGGEPVFHLDVRPALDSFDNTKLRVTVAIEHLLSRVHAPQLHIKLTWCIYGLLFCFVLLECM